MIILSIAAVALFVVLVAFAVSEKAGLWTAKFFVGLFEIAVLAWLASGII